MWRNFKVVLLVTDGPEMILKCLGGGLKGISGVSKDDIIQDKGGGGGYKVS